METRIRVMHREILSTERHLSGMRRRGTASPVCPSCSTLMFCIFSLDPQDSSLAGSPVYGLEDLDFFVCPACPMYTQGYYVRSIGDRVEILYDGSREGPYAHVLLPYPQAPVELSIIPPDEVSTAPGILVLMEGRELWDGVYHRISPNILWGKVDRDLICPVCASKMRQVAIIDSDETLGLQQDFGEGRQGRLSLNWVDDYYLAVSLCVECATFGYHPAHGK